MKIVSIICLIMLISCDGGEAKQAFPYEIHEKTLANGLNVIAIPFDSPGLVTFSTAVRVGSRNEVEKGVTGFAHFFEHLMFYGTKTRGKSDAAKFKKAMAAGGNAYTWDDQTIYYLTGNSEKLEDFFKLNSDNFKNLHFTGAEFRREAGAVLGEYTKNFSGWYRQMDAKLREIAFKSHTYGHTTMGYEEDIKDMPNQFEYAWTFFNRFYRPEYCSLIIVGDINPTTVFQYAEKYYSDWKRGDYVASIPTERPQTEERTAHITRGDVLPTLMMGYKNLGYNENLREFISLEIISELLTSKKSELYQRLVNKEQKAKMFFSWNYEKRDPLYFGIVVRSDKSSPKDLIYLKGEIEKEIERIKTVPQDLNYLNDIKSNKKYTFLAELNNPQSIALQVAEKYQVTGKSSSINSYFAELDKVTPEDIMKAAQTYLINERRSVVSMAGDEKGVF